MHLKKIEISGFKSFADSVELSFEPGVTCIVGPNGCGKSNISDAIRWVLGERSAKLLRGSRMEDVIFSGTESRKPIHFTGVSLTIDNTDQKLPLPYSEVVIARRLHRSGESEYLINKTPCRLKDVMDLILDTGIGSSSYSMIEQGRIDYILNAAAEERRSLIEEAAGISKYKVKKEEAVRKLERTEENLLRLNDIISEVERNIKYAERQARRAERYREQIEKLKALEIRKAFYDLKQKDAVLQGYADEKRSYEETCEGLEKNVRQNEDELLSCNQDLERLDGALFKEEQARASIKEELVSLEHQEIFGREKIEALKLSAEKAAGEIESLSHNLLHLKSEVEQKRLQRELLEKQIGSLEMDILLKKDLLSAPPGSSSSNIAEAVETERTKLFEFARELAERQNHLNQCRAELAACERMGEASLSREKKLSEEKDCLIARETAIRNERSAVQSAKERIVSVLKALANERLELEEKLSVLLHEEEGQKIEDARIQNQLAVLEEINDSESADPKAVAQLANAAHQVVKAVLDVIEITSGYEHAVESVLSSLLKGVVAETMPDALRLLEAARRNGTNQTTIFIRDRAELNGSLKDDSLAEAHPAIRGKLLNFVRVEPGYEGVIGRLLAGAYVADDLSQFTEEDLSELARRIKLVTQSGAILGPEFQITFRGKSLQARQQGIITRAKEIERLRVELESRSHALVSLEANRIKITERLKEAETLEARQREDERTGEMTMGRVLSVSSELEIRRRQVDDELSVIETDLVQAAQNSETLEEKIRALNRSISTIEEDRAKSQALLEKLEQEEYSRKEERSDMASAVSQLSLKMEMLMDKKSGADETILLMERQIEGASNRIENLQAERLEARKKVEFLSVEAGSLGAKRREVEAQLISRSASVEQVRAARTDTTARRNALLEARNRFSASLESTHRLISDLRLKEMEVNHQKDSIIHDLETRYRIKLAELDSSAFILSQDELPEVSEHIEELRSKIESAGAVNLLAVEEFGELKQRFDFLDGQRRDLEQAKESLLESIRHINRTTRKLFDETYAKVKAAFREYFRILFGGGDADLLLLDEEHPLDSGLEIAARPPGKKLQMISLLSGGEKALTAIALLLALFSVRPSPFCVLDEVDAPLDEANNERFLHALKPFLGNTQFIIITHSRKTITLANALYGVTMQEQGVSTIVSVKLSQDENSILHADGAITTELNQVLT